MKEKINSLIKEKDRISNEKIMFEMKVKQYENTNGNVGKNSTEDYLRKKIVALEAEIEVLKDKNNSSSHNNSSYFIRNEFENDNLKVQISNMEILLEDFKKRYERAIEELRIEKNENIELKNYKINLKFKKKI